MGGADRCAAGDGRPARRRRGDRDDGPPRAGDAPSRVRPAGIGSPAMATLPSYVSGTSTTPLLGETIGATLDRTVERFGAREALVSRPQDVRYSYAELADAVDRVARG